MNNFKNIFLKLRFALLIVFCVIVLILSVGYVQEDLIPQIKDKKSLPFVKSIHLDEATIAGTNIPPVPNEAENNATLLGVDANKNYIRDDVELAIYAQYASSTQERVALLGYAQALEMRYRVSWKEGHQYVEDVIDSYQTCLYKTLNPPPLFEEQRGLEKQNYRKKRDVIIDGYDSVVEREIIFNTRQRKDYLSQYYETSLKFGGSTLGGNSCPLDFNKIK